LRLSYEDLLEDPTDFVRRALAFLDAGIQPTVGATLKNTADDLRHAITNFDQLRARYVGTKYEQMFDEAVLSAAS
jgi:hypothetical protein